MLVHPRILSTLLAAMLKTNTVFALCACVSPMLRDVARTAPIFIATVLILVNIKFSVNGCLNNGLTSHSIGNALGNFLLLLVIVVLTVPFLTHGRFNTTVDVII